MPKYHPIFYCVPHGGTAGKTVEADSPEAAFRKAVGEVFEKNPVEVEAMIRDGELEVIAVIEGDPRFADVRNVPLFPGF